MGIETTISETVQPVGPKRSRKSKPGVTGSRNPEHIFPAVAGNMDEPSLQAEVGKGNVGTKKSKRSKPTPADGQKPQDTPAAVANVEHLPSKDRMGEDDISSKKHKKSKPAPANCPKAEDISPAISANMDGSPSQTEQGKEAASEKAEKPTMSKKSKKDSKIPFSKYMSDLRYTAPQITHVFGEPSTHPKTLNAIPSKPGILAFVLLYQTPPQRNMKSRHEFFVANGNFHLLFQEGTRSNAVTSPSMFPELVVADVSKVIFPVFLGSEHTRRFEAKGSWECLGWNRIKAVSYLQPQSNELVKLLKEEWGEWTTDRATEELLWKTGAKKKVVVVETERVPDRRLENPMEDVEGTSEAAAARIFRRQKLDKVRQQRHLNKDIRRFQPVVDRTVARKERKKLVREEKENLKSMRDLSLESYEESKASKGEEWEMPGKGAAEDANELDNEEVPLQASPPIVNGKESKY
ncbi:MAG: hypothetical protein Q9187_000071 [Circinaria calcarea]